MKCAIVFSCIIANFFIVYQYWIIGKFNYMWLFVVAFYVHRCTLRRVRFVIILIYVCAVVVNVPDWFTIVVTPKNGSIRFNETEFYSKTDPYNIIYQVWNNQQTAVIQTKWWHWCHRHWWLQMVCLVILISYC